MRIERLRNRRDILHGFDIEESRERLAWYAVLLDEVARLHLRWLPATPMIDAKVLLAIHAAEDAGFALRIAERVAELGGADPAEQPPGLHPLVAHLRSVASWDAYIGAVYSVVKPALVDRWEDHYTGTNLLLDEPTARLLGDLMRVMPQHISGGMTAVEAIAQSGGQHAAAVAETRRHWAALESGDVPAPETRPATPHREIPARDTHIRIEDKTLVAPISAALRQAAALPEEDLHRAAAPELHAWMNEELIRAELLASAAADTAIAPVRRDRIARLVWDRARHVQALEKLLELCGEGWGAHPVTMESWRLGARAPLCQVADDALHADGLATAFAAAGRAEIARVLDALHEDNEAMRRACRALDSAT